MAPSTSSATPSEFASVTLNWAPRNRSYSTVPLSFRSNDSTPPNAKRTSSGFLSYLVLHLELPQRLRLDLVQPVAVRVREGDEALLPDQDVELAVRVVVPCLEVAGHLDRDLGVPVRGVIVLLVDAHPSNVDVLGVAIAVRVLRVDELVCPLAEL